MASCALASSAAELTPACRVLRSRFRSRNWGCAGAWTAPRPARPPRPCSGHAGAWRTFGSAPAPAGAARCPAAAAPAHPPALPREGSESPSAVSGARPLRLQTPPTASVEQHATASRPSPSGDLAVSLDPAACLQCVTERRTCSACLNPLSAALRSSSSAGSVGLPSLNCRMANRYSVSGCPCSNAL